MKGEMTNCPNCGAPIRGFECEYCGTPFRGLRATVPGIIDDACGVDTLESETKLLEQQVLLRQLYVDAIMAMRHYDSSRENHLVL